MLRASIPANIEIQTGISTGSDWVLADSTQIHQLLMNLCTNAAQAMKGQVGTLGLCLDEVRVDFPFAHPGLKEGSYVKITVNDTGHGIPAMIMDRIFDPYSTTKQRGEGTGLGLAVVEGVVKNHNGIVTVASEVGKGTFFSVFLPQLESMQEQSDIELVEPPRGKGLILFVDDEPVLVEIGCKILRNLGYTAVGKTSSLEALKDFAARPGKFDLVITDLSMPKMTGLGLVEQIISLRPDIPIIMCMYRFQ